MLHNGFNLNSTDYNSWLAVLSGKSFSSETLHLRYERSHDWFTPSNNLRQVFFNHPQNSIYGLTEQSVDPAYHLKTRVETEQYPNCFATTATGWRSDKQHPSLIQNLREISTSELAALTHAILKELKTYFSTHGHPPLSMQSFVQSHLLQNAIDAVPSLNLRRNGLDYIAPGSPSHFSQLTLLKAIAPFAFLRSDTFTLHAAARMCDSRSGKVTSKIRCQVQAQRLPTEHSNPRFGRQFRFSHFSWVPQK